MTMRLVVSSVLALLMAAPARGADPSGLTTAKVTYVTSSTVYVDAGAESGVRVGDAVKVYRDGAFVTALEVTAVASRRASCRRADPEASVASGDEIRFRAAPNFVAATDPAAGGTPPVMTAGPSGGSVSRWLGDHGVRGRIGLRYLGLFDQSSFGENYSQPALDVRLQAASLGHPAIHFETDVRANRTWRTRAEGEGTTEGRTRVYRLTAEWSRGADGFRAVAGRQPSTALVALGIFDGLSAEFGSGRWRFGALSGSQPDPSTFGFSQEIWEHGVYVDWRERASGASRWRLTTGLVGSYTDNVVNRENVILQARYSGERLFASAIQDVDLNRGWKQDAGESPVQLTSSFASARWRFAERLSLDAGLDTRRTVRLYRDRETPETEFDDSYRQGYWSGVDYEPLRNTRVGVNVRRTSGGTSGAAHTATATASTGVPSFHGVSLRMRSTYYENDMVEGWLHSAGTGASLGSRLHVDVGGGLREDTTLLAVTTRNRVRWYSLDADCRVTRGWALLLSLERSRGDDQRTDQVYASALYRF
jgi:hypothetical protein